MTTTRKVPATVVGGGRPSLRRHVAGPAYGPSTSARGTGKQPQQCTCVEEVGRELAKQNTRLVLSYFFGPKPRASVPIVATELVEKQRGKRAVVLVPTFCPFCGVKYPKDEP